MADTNELIERLKAAIHDREFVQDAVEAVSAEIERLQDENARWMRRHTAREAINEMSDSQVRERLADEWASVVWWQDRCERLEAENRELLARIRK